MARKGNFSFDSDDDLNFGDELFPIDDSAFDDSGLDFLEGLDGKPKATSGVGGFFKNAVKSVKGLGLDVVNEFLPATIDMKDSISFALQDAKSTLSEKKDWAAEKLGEMRSKKSDVSVGATIKNAFKTTANNIKQGKFYKSSLDMSDMDMDMSSFFNDDNDDEDFDSEDTDTSGTMTTSYKATAKKSARPISVVNYNTDTQGMIEATAAIQQDAVTASARVSTRIANKQSAMLEQNFAIQRAYLQNIANNLTNAVNFMFNEGSTSLKAQLEYSAKSLAFMTDQNNLLKEQIKLANKQLGFDMDKVAGEEVDEKFNPFSGGMFDMSKYFQRIGKNAKDMFGGTTLGFGYDSIKQMQELSGSMGMKMGVGDLVKNMAKGGLMSALFSGNTKGRFDKINTMFENLGYGFTAKANSWKNDESGIKRFFGNLLGYDESINKNVDMGIAGRTEEPVPFDRKTRMTVNDVIPGQLNQIIKLLGGKGQYFDYKQGLFRTEESKLQEYKMAQQEVYDRDLEFSSSFEAIKKQGVTNKNSRYKELTDKDRDSAFKLFQDNMVKKRVTLYDNLFSDMNYETDDKTGSRQRVGDLAAIFDGFDEKFGRNSEKLKQLIEASVTEMRRRDPASINILNRRVFKVGEELESTIKAIKEDAMKHGGATALAYINQQEKFEAEDYDLKHSSMYNENHIANRNNDIAKRKARQAALVRKSQQFYERGGVIGEEGVDSYGRVEGSAASKVNDIYELLLNGINVFPSKPTKEQNEFLSKASINTANVKNKIIRDKIDQENMMRARSEESMEAARDLSAIEAGRKFSQYDSGFLQAIRNNLGTDFYAEKALGIFAPLFQMAGMGDEYKEALTGEIASSEAAKAEIAKMNDVKKARVEGLSKSIEKLSGSKHKVLAGAGKAALGIKNKFEEKTENYVSRGMQKEAKRRSAAEKARARNAKRNALRFKEWEGINALERMYRSAKNSDKRNFLVYAPSLTQDQMDSWLVAVDDSYMGIKFVDEISPDTDIIIGKLTKAEEIANREKIEFFGIKQFEKKDCYEEVNDFVNNEEFINYKFEKDDLREKWYEYSIGKPTDVFTTLEKKRNEAIEKISKQSGTELKKSAVRTHGFKMSDIAGKSDNEVRSMINEKINSNYNANVKKMKDAMPKSLSKIKGSAAAFKAFKNKTTRADIDKLLSSRNYALIREFASNIRSKNDSMGIQNSSEYLRGEFGNAVNGLLGDEKLAGQGVRIRESIRSPLMQLAYYSLGRTEPGITDELMKMAGVKEGIGYWSQEVVDGAMSGRYVADTLDSNHMKGLAVDLDLGKANPSVVGKLAETKYGITWGGNWSNSDPSHFETGAAVATSGKGKKSFDVVDLYKADAETESTADEKKAESIKLSDNLKDSEYGKEFRGNKPLFLIHNRLLEIREILKDLSVNTGYMGMSMGVPGLLKKGGKFVLDTGKGTFKFLKDKVSKITGMARDVGEKAKDGINKIKDKFGSGSDGSIINTLKAKATGLKNKVLGTGVSDEEISKMKKKELVEIAVSKLGLSEDEAKSMKVDELRKYCLEKNKSILGSAKSMAGGIIKTGSELANKGLNFGIENGKKFADWGMNKVNDIAGKVSTKFAGKNYFQKGSDTVKEFLEDKKTKISDIKARVLKDLEGKLSPEDIEKIKNWPKDKKAELIEFVKNKYDELNPSSGSSLIKTAGGLLSGAVGVGKGAFEGIKNKLSGVSGGAGGGIGGLFGKNKSLEVQMQTLAETRAIRMMLSENSKNPPDVSTLLSDIRSSVESSSGGSGGGLGKILGAVSSGVGTLAKSAGGLAKGALGLAGKGIAGAAGLFGKTVPSILSAPFKLLGFGADKLGDLKEWLGEKKVKDKAIAGAKDTKEKISEKFSTLKNKLSEKSEEFKEKLKERKEKIVNGARNNKTNERGQVEGSYEDQKSDAKEAEQEKREEEKSTVLKAIAGALGVKAFRNATDTTVIDKLEEIDENGEATNKALGKIKNSSGKGSTLKEKLLSTGSTIAAAGIGAAAVGAVGAGIAAAGTAVKRVGGKIVDTFKHTKGGGIGQKMNSLFGSTNESNYNEDGTEKTDQEKKNSRARINVGSVATLGKYMGLLEKLISKVLSNPKCAKLFGKFAGDGLVKGTIKMISKGMAKGAGKVAGKIAGMCAKLSNPVGWALTIAQAVAAVVSGWSNTKRYFNLGKGIEPTIPMKITSAIVSLLSDFVFGLIPVPEMVNWIFNLTASDETKKSMEEGRGFVEKRAKILGVESKRLTEYETKTIMERIFGNDKKWANVLGFSKGNNDKDGVAIYKRWKDEKYKPLDDMFNDMVKQWGKKVTKVAANEEDARYQSKFRETYLKKAEEYVKAHNLEWLKAGAKAEDEFAKGKEDEKTTITEGEKDEANEATAAESKAVATSQTAQTKALNASVSVPESDNSIPKEESSGSASISGASSNSVAGTQKATPIPEIKPESKTSIQKANEATAAESKAVATSQTAQVVGGKVVGGNMSQEDYEARQRALDLRFGKVYKTNGNVSYSVDYEWNKSKKYYEPNVDRMYALGADEEYIQEFLKENPKYDANGYEVKEENRADSWHGLNIGPVVGLKGMSAPKKKISKGILGKAVTMAKQNIQRAIDLGTTIKEKAAKALSNTVFGRMVGGAKKAIASGASKIGGFFKKSGEKLLSKIRDFKSGLSYITENRVEVQNKLKEAIANGDSQGILDLIRRVKNKDMMGQQTTTDGLNPVMKERVEAFLNDPEVVGHGVRIRESIRPITSQIAYFLKGRAPNDVTDAAMKEAGFKFGINFWGKNFQNMGDTVTTTIGSNHFNGTAVDLEPGDIGYEKLGKIAAKYGLEWGGSWTGFKDPPHFELDPNWHGNLPVNDDNAVGTIGANYQADSEGTSFDLAAKVTAKPKLSGTGRISGNKSSSTVSISKKGNASPVGILSKVGALSSSGSTPMSRSSDGVAELVSRAIETDRLLERGLAILDQLYQEERRHNQINEEQLKNVLNGISLLGKILTAGLSSIGNGMSGSTMSSINSGANITGGVFDKLARGN